MNYSRPWMFSGLALMAAGAVLLSMRSDPTIGQDKIVGGDSSRRSVSETDENRRQESPPTTTSSPDENRRQESPPTAEAKQPEIKWKSLFDGKTLKGWKAPQFGGEGKVTVSDGAIVMEMGSMMTGVTWTGKPPKNNFELTLEGKRLEGCDFFCTTTFPVGEEHCSLVVGGWGGILVGLSNVDRRDASENDTTSTYDLDDNKWYRIRIRVTDAAVEAWIGDDQVVNQPRKDHKFGIRDEVDLCRPLGICTWCTKGAVRNIRLRELKK